MDKCIRIRGYTLVELLVAISVLMMVLLSAGPSMSGIIVSIKVQGGAQAMLDTLELARSEAVKRNGRVVICKSAAGGGCDRSSGWAQGWIVFQDSNNNGQLDAGESTLHRESALQGAIQLQANAPVRDYVSYTPFGRSKLTSGAFQAGTFTICLKSGGLVEARQVVINSAGRPRVAKAVLTECPVGTSA